ncbi:MAG: aldehyde dehydrogenase family protein [Limnochordia bacterium]|jgi:acyl-CoA reductase-like NAD-dependent aldehyde dehydrogenase
MKMIIGGQQVDAKDGKVVEILNPATNEIIDTVPSATVEDVERALDIAQEGKKIWADTPLHERCRILMVFADLVEKNKEELAVLLCKETGKAIREARTEIGGIPNMVRAYAERAKHLYGSWLSDSHPGTERDIILTRREPLGVVVCVVPFNFPASSLCHKIAPALAMGNSVICKPPSDNPLNNIRLVELLLEAGVPGSVAQILTGSGAVLGKQLISTPKVNAVSLTGSTEVGVTVTEYASKYLHHVMLELGGNDALIVFEDADLDLLMKELLQSRASCAGQICSSTKRLLVQNSIKEEVAQRLVETLSAIRVGDPMDPETDIGCLISEKAAMEVEKQVQHTIEQGAKCILGGKRFNGTFFEMTVLVDVTPEMDIAKDMEVFGPVFPIIGFETLEEAISIANASKYGLMGGVMTKDLDKAMKVAFSLETGGAIINGAGRYRTPDFPFGGCKMSGIGREGASTTLEEMSQIKSIVLKGVR